MLGRPDSGRCLSRRRIPVSADEESRRLAFVRERAVRDELTLLKEAEERGIEKGVEIGVEKGAQEKSRNTLTKLLTLRFGPLSEAVAQRLGEARVEQLDAWTEKVLFARTLEDVFQD